MLKMFTLILILFIYLLLSIQPVTAAGKGDNLTDKRTKILSAYLLKNHSPLTGNARDFVESAQKYNLDWKLVAAIAGTESTFGKFVPGNTLFPSFNAWGWGVYGDQTLYFKSWREGIYTVTEGLRKDYFDKGYTNPYSINQAYAESPNWGARVSWFLKDMENFQTQYELENLGVSQLALIAQTAGSSATVGN